MNMNVLKIYLQKIKELSAPFYQSMADKCRQAHQKYLENQRLIAQQNLNSRIQMQHDILQNDFAFVLENFTYPKLVQVTSKADLRQDGYKITKEYIIYYFTIFWQNLINIEETCARVALPFGTNVVSVTPVIIPT